MKKRVKSLPWVVSYASRNFVKFCLLWIFSLSSLMIQAQDNQRISIDLRGETLEAALWYLAESYEICLYVWNGRCR